MFFIYELSAFCNQFIILFNRFVITVFHLITVSLSSMYSSSKSTALSISLSMGISLSSAKLASLLVKYGLRVMFIGFLVSELIGRSTFSLLIYHIPLIEGKQI
ncbi:hypothetical protein [Peribacillus frigoritolerans]|uniref:hypothetical protein n=1 Tax=Peribacillus frigoritolerans TaxID=450367 RepID=UPI003F53C212